MRKGEKPEDDILIVCNLTPVPRNNYRIGVPQAGEWKELLNSDDLKYGGSGVINQAAHTNPQSFHGREQNIEITLSPLAVSFWKLS